MSTDFEKELIDRQGRAIAPSIFIGLGGVGCKIIKRLAAIADREAPEASKNVCFVAMDTDVNDLRMIKAENKNIVTIQTSERKTIGEYLDDDENARKNWFPLNDILVNKTPTEGAGQIRAISNLVAHNAARLGELGDLDRAIDSLFPLNTDEMQQSARITIVGTITGGTGSGLILPITLYVKNYLEKARQQKSSVVRGFFFLPDAMDSVVTKETERNNLRSNAYASIREIDAFMRWKFDHKLRERYPNLRVIMPKVGGGGYSEFNNAPFNFCFLFNKLDSKSTSIFDHYDLLDHAAECIFDMTISPITARVNSQEDNIIREITKSKNSSSYAGAGASKMEYPYDDIVEYIALNWTKQVTSKQWLEADYAVEEKKIENQKRRNSGEYVPEVNEEALYVGHIKTLADQEDSFYMGIHSQCLEEKDKSGNRIELSKRFVRELENYTEKIRRNNFEGSVASIDLENAWQLSLEAIKKNEIAHEKQGKERQIRAAKVDEALNLFFKAHDDAINDARAQVVHIATSIINMKYNPEGNTTGGQVCLEKYMYKSKDVFMHPNAARYFLINTSQELERRIAEYRLQLNEVKLTYDGTLANLEELRSMDDNENAKAENAIVQKVKRDSKEPYEPSKRSKNANTYFKTMFKDGGIRASEDGSKSGILDDYCFYLVNIAVFEKINSYVKSLISGYKEFYKKIRHDIESLDSKIEEIENRYANVSGRAMVYVCASPKSLKKLLSQCKCSIGAFDIPVGLTKGIYDKAKKYADMNRDGSFNDEFGINEDSSDSEKTDAMNAFFGDIFETVIMDFWRASVKHDCDSKLDVDIIRALYNEAFFEEGCRDTKSKLDYMVSKIIGAENLSVPFIDSPNGQPRTISVMAMNKDVEESLNGEEMNAMIKAMQGEFNRISSPEISKYVIRFYQSVYNIKAKDLVKFSCASDTSEGDSCERFGSCGTYSRVYHERISNIEPLDEDNTEITPHLEKTWQYINVLPEIDEDFQHREEVRIAKAFVYALVFGKVAYRQHDLNGYNYCYEIIDPTVEAPELYVSNGTRCDQFYELLDAFTLCPRYVDRLLDLMKQDIQFEKNLGHSFNETRFASKLATSVFVDEFSISQKMNIFYIPLLYKVSAASNYISAWGEAMLEAIFEIIDEYINELEDDKSKNDIKCKFLSEDIFENYHGNIDNLVALKDGDMTSKLQRKHSRLERIKNDTLTLRVYDLIADILKTSDSLNPHVGQYSEAIEKIETARRQLGSEALAKPDNQGNN